MSIQRARHSTQHCHRDVPQIERRTETYTSLFIFPTVFLYLLSGIFALRSDHSSQAALNSSALCLIPLECLISSHSGCFVYVCAWSNQGGFPGQFLFFSHHNHASLPESVQFQPKTYSFLQCLSGYILVSRNYCDVRYNLYLMT